MAGHCEYVTPNILHAEKTKIVRPACLAKDVLLLGLILCLSAFPGTECDLCRGQIESWVMRRDAESTYMAEISAVCSDGTKLPEVRLGFNGTNQAPCERPVGDAYTVAMPEDGVMSFKCAPPSSQAALLHCCEGICALLHVFTFEKLKESGLLTAAIISPMPKYHHPL